MISRNQDTFRIKFLEDAMPNKQAEIVETPIVETPKETKIQPQTKKSNNNDAVRSRFRNVILSAGEGNITDMGGPNKYQGFDSNNSIWDSDILSRVMDQTTNKEKTLKQKERINKLRNSLEEGRIDEMVDSLQSTETDKNANVTAMGEYSEKRKYKVSKNNIGLFDNKEFSDLPEQTEGEKMAERARSKKEKDDSWKETKSATKMTNTLDNLFNILTEEDNG